MNSESSVIEIPSNFRYRDVFLKGKPKHDKTDSFSIKHPAMDLGRRAKIFSPFDALKGFSDELAKSEQLICNDLLSRENLQGVTTNLFNCY